jgi:transcriptional regulator with XRE-family HTH domain
LAKKRTSEIDPSFISRLQHVISEVGSAEKLAKLTGISGRGLGTYAKGEADPSRAKILQICKASGVSVGWLLTGEGPIKKGENPTPAKVKIESETLIVPMKDLYPDSLPYDQKLLKELVIEIEEYLLMKNARIPPSKKAEILTMLYEQFLSQELNKKNDKGRDHVQRLLSVVL